MKYEPHPLSLVFPEMSAEDYRRLRDDIKRNGLRHPITLYEGMVLDGRHRLKACEETGVPARFEQHDPALDPGDFVISENLTRRNLTPTQIARASLRFEAAERERAAQRKAHGDTAPGRPNAPRPVAGSVETGDTMVILGRKFGIAENTVRRVANATKNGVPELVKAMDDGEITATEASRISQLQPKSQKRLVALPRGERKRAMGTAVAISQARKATKPAQVEPAGTELTRALLGRVELIANDLSGRGLKDRVMIIERFNTEFGWGDSVQLQQLWHCMPTLQMLGELYALAAKRSSSAVARVS